MKWLRNVKRSLSEITKAQQSPRVHNLDEYYQNYNNIEDPDISNLSHKTSNSSLDSEGFNLILQSSCKFFIADLN